MPGHYIYYYAYSLSLYICTYIYIYIYISQSFHLMGGVHTLYDIYYIYVFLFTYSKVPQPR